MTVSYAEIQPEGQKKSSKVWYTIFQLSVAFECSSPVHLQN